MKRPHLKSLLLLLFFFSVAASAQQRFPFDSVRYVSSIMPFKDSVDLRTVTYASYTVSDSISASLNISAPIFYNFYTNVPGLPGTFANVGKRRDGIRFMPAILYTIDGMPYNSSIGLINTLNNFEIGNAVVAPGIHGASSFGSWGTNGVYFLESKSGEGFSNGVVELNSTTAKSESEFRFNDDFFADDRIKIDYLQQTTNVAWKRDFGKIDTRVSLNHQVSRGDGNLSSWDVNEKWYAASANTGFNAGRLKARFIGNYNFRDLDAPEGETRGKNAIYSGQLKLQYVLKGNLQLHSNTMFQRANWDKNDVEGYSKSWEKRLITNLFLNHKIRREGISLNSFGGVHVERWMDKPFSFPGYVEDHEWEAKGTSAVLGTETLIAKSLAFRIVTRRDFTKEEGWWSSTFGAAFNFVNHSSGAVDLKLRASYGIGSVGKPIVPSRAPVEFYFPSSSYDIYIGCKKRSFETGLDFFASPNRNFSATLNYYRDVIEDRWYPVGGTMDVKAEGIEMLATVNSRLDHVLLSNRLLFGFSKLDDPAWTEAQRKRVSVSLINNLKLLNAHFNLVTELRNIQGNNSDSPVFDGSYLWIRNAAFMYTLNTTKNADIGIGLVGRNLLIGKPKGSFSPENFNFATKSVSLNLTLTLR
jgi:hypothetical protein